MNIFYSRYKEFMDNEMIRKFEQYKLLTDTVINISDILPDFLDVSYIYYNCKGTEIPDMDKILEILDKKGD
jgi:hypothetical protein